MFTVDLSTIKGPFVVHFRTEYELRQFVTDERAACLFHEDSPAPMDEDIEYYIQRATDNDKDGALRFICQWRNTV